MSRKKCFIQRDFIKKNSINLIFKIKLKLIDFKIEENNTADYLIQNSKRNQKTLD